MITLLLLACRDPEGVSSPTDLYPYLYTPEEDLEPWEEVRVETETWRPEDDPDELALYVRKAFEHRKGAPVESLEHFAAMRAQIPALGEGLRISLVGDIMWIGGNWTAAAEAASPLLDGDLRVGNLETPTSPSYSTEQGALGVYAFNSPPEYLDGLPFDLLQLNNNHSLDAGEDGLTDTLAEVDARGIGRTGVDGHARVGEVALLSYTWGLNAWDVEPARELFVVPFGHLDEEIDLSGVSADIEAARAEGAASVVVLLHWGYEYEYYPDPHFMVLAREIIAAGADLIVGSGPHVVQPPELCHVNDPDRAPGVGTCAITTEDGAPRTAAVLYSLGNFATDMNTVPCQVGLVATVSLDPDVTGLGWAAVANVDGPAVVPLDDALEDPDLAEEDARLREHLGEGWRRDGGRDGGRGRARL